MRPKPLAKNFSVWLDQNRCHRFLETSATGFSAGQGQSTHLGVPRVAVGELRRGCATSPYPRLTYPLLAPCSFPLLSLLPCPSELSRRCRRSGHLRPPGVDSFHPHLPRLVLHPSPSSFEPFHGRNCFPIDVAAWRFASHVDLPSPAFFAQTEHGVSITASPSTFPSPSFFHSERWAPICAPLAETGTTGFGNPVPPVLIWPVPETGTTGFVIRYHRFC